MVAKPKPTKQPKKKRKLSNGRKVLEQQLEAMVKQLIFWRDGQECVQKSQGGCGNGLMWGHYIAQGQSSWLKYDLGNVFVQCGNHNLLDYHGDKSYSTWYHNTFGTNSAELLDRDKREHKNTRLSMVELRELLAHYERLYQDRFYTQAILYDLIRDGYYGENIKKAFGLDGTCANNCRHSGS